MNSLENKGFKMALRVTGMSVLSIILSYETVLSLKFDGIEINVRHIGYD